MTPYKDKDSEQTVYPGLSVPVNSKTRKISDLTPQELIVLRRNLRNSIGNIPNAAPTSIPQHEALPPPNPETLNRRNNLLKQIGDRENKVYDHFDILNKIEERMELLGLL